MATFAALKPCRFGSVFYGQGDIIPDGVVLPKRALALTRMGYIAPSSAKRPPYFYEGMHDNRLMTERGRMCHVPPPR